MTDNRKNIKVPEHVHAELDADRDMSWPDYLLHLKRVADRGPGDFPTADVKEAMRDVLREELQR